MAFDFEKQCSKCRDSKPSSEFYKNAQMRDGVQNQCKECTKQRTRERCRINAARIAISVPSTKRCFRCQTNKSSDVFPKNKGNFDGLGTYCTSCVRSLKYGMVIDYDELFSLQNGSCAICRKSCSRKQTLSVDHNHRTNKVRGLLCTKCNLGIGYFDEDPDLMVAAIEYLRAHSEEDSVL